MTDSTDLWTQAAALLERDPILNADLLDRLKHRQVRRLFLETEGLLLLEAASGIFMLSAETAASALRLMDIAAENGCTMLTYHAPVPREAALDRLHFSGGCSCLQAVYCSAAPLPLRGCLDINRLDSSYLSAVTAEYSLLSAEELAEYLERGQLFGGFLDGELIGFAGTHTEGSIGLLHVLSRYRRHGYGEELERFMINRRLSLGHIPYAQIILGNTNSMALQKKLGLTIAEMPVHWVY